MTRRRWLLGGALLGGILLLFVLPLQTRSGVIDTTTTLCLGSSPTTTKRYHVLLGQLHDYQLVRPHILPASRQSGCGQRARLQLYL